MPTAWRHRALSVVGAASLTGVAVTVANHPFVQELSMVVPVYNRLQDTTLTNGQLELALLTSIVAVVVAMLPLYRPRPRRALDTIALAVQRVFAAMIALAAVGYFDYTYRLPRTTLILTTGMLIVVMPIWFVSIRSRPAGTTRRAVIVGDDPTAMETILEETDLPIIGYVSPPSANGLIETSKIGSPAVTDGGVTSVSSLSNLECLGGLSRLDEVLVKHDVDTAILAFSHPDRAEFFGTLDTCYEHGVTAKVHRDHADTVLTTDIETGDLIDIDLDPWSWWTYVVKRAFDVTFSIAALVVLSPVMVMIAIAIKLDDGGPVLYHQRRTASFGETFTVAKFRSMTPHSEDIHPVDDEHNDRITRVGRLLRKSHLDEIPQLWAVLIGDMSVVGPRATWTDEESLLENRSRSWRRRWFVKPGLTGLAQINDVTSTDPEEKLRFDVVYIRNQSFWFDLKIVIRQLWLVVVDVGRTVMSRD